MFIVKLLVVTLVRSELMILDQWPSILGLYLKI